MTVANLLALNVNEHTEKKANLTYLSWAWAWAEALKADPQASFTVQMFGDKCYMEINGTAMVWVTVTMFGKPMVCQLPVMDNTNKPITIEGTTTVNKYGKEVTTKLDSFNVNTAIMRCMTKALSLHGLGLYIYSGDDLPSFVEPESTIDPDTMTDLFLAIHNAKTQDELKIAYKVAYAACDGDKAWQMKVIAAKDEAKGKL
jgi:hypothetical protein